VSSIAEQALEGATLAPLRWPYLGPYTLRQGDKVVSSFRFVHMSWTRRASGEFLGQPWTLRSHGVLHEEFEFRRGGWDSDDVAARYQVLGPESVRDLDGAVYVRGEGGCFVNESSQCVLRRHYPWKDGERPEWRLGDHAYTEPRIEWLALMLDYLLVRAYTRPTVSG
jgi:hypothetical protein